MKLLACAFLALSLLTLNVQGQNSGTMTNAFSINRYFAKGGIGIITTKLYVVVSSNKNDVNELVLKSGDEAEVRWRGRSVTKSQVVLYCDDKIWVPDDLPEKFDLSKCVVISFEVDKVRFFDFQTMDGGYYARIIE